MLDAFSISSTGLQAQQTHVETIANNLANVNTDGYKKSKVNFQNLVSSQLGSTSLGLINNLEQSTGIGTTAGIVDQVFTLGDPKPTERELDIFIQGNGFLEVTTPDGEYAYTRIGSLSLDNNGVLTSVGGFALSSSIQIPPDAQQVLINSDGVVSISLNGENEAIEIGQVELANFINPAGLSPLGSGLYLPSEASGDVSYGRPGELGFGELRQGFLESSNVNLVEELTSLTIAQRGYQMNARVVQAADEMLSIINTLRR